MRICPHGHDLDVVRCLACRVEGFRGLRLGTIRVPDGALPRSLSALEHIRKCVADAFRFPDRMLVRRTKRCWQCAAEGKVERVATEGEIYCAHHRAAVEEAMEREAQVHPEEAPR